ncbi:MAG TPA: GH25 family lysozyme, partial [Streptosporangiaceae bacterium]
MALGRSPLTLRTLFRHSDIQTVPRGSTWDEAKDHWRRMFARFVDRTYLEHYASHIDLINEANEYTALSTWRDDPDHGALALMNMQAAAWVWNNEYRGRLVRSADGGEGFVPPECKLCLMSGPVANWFPKSVLDLSVAEDCPIDYHCYILVKDGVRQPEDWREHSGLWHFLEQEHGVRPEWVGGEGGLYRSTFEGWRSGNVAGGSLPLYQTILSSMVADMVRTPAFEAGRFLGFVLFTTGRVGGWENYELDTDEMKPLATATTPIWEMAAPSVVDWSMYQSKYLGDPTNIVQKYDPNYWRVDIDWPFLETSPVDAIIIRVGIGTRKDPCFDRYLAGILASPRYRDRWGIYHVFDDSVSPEAQAEAARSWCRNIPPLGVTGDLELKRALSGDAMFAATDRYLRALDYLFGVTTRIYSGAWFMDPTYSVEHQRAWSNRAGWWSGYPTLYIPNGWEGTAQPWTLHQFTDEYWMAGLKRPCDLSRLAPNLTIQDLYDRPEETGIAMYLSLPHLTPELQAAVDEHMVALDADVAQNNHVAPYNPPPAPAPATLPYVGRVRYTLR